LRNFELADGDVALGQHGGGNILGTDQRIGARHDDDGVVGVGDGDHGRPGMDIRGVLDLRKVDALRSEERSQLLAEGIHAQPADQRGRCTQLRGGDRLVGALAARKIMHGLAGNGLADPGMPGSRRHHIHIDAAGDQDTSHA
jgi:hypothetical protein